MAEEEKTDAVEAIEGAEGEEGAPSGGKKKWILLGALLVSLAGGGAGTFFLMTGGAEEGAETETEQEEALDTLEEEQVATFVLEPVIVNAVEGERDRYLKVAYELELTTPEVVPELERRLPQIKDLLITLMSAQQLSDLRSLEGKSRLREDVQVRLNTMLRAGKVRRVFFTEFVIQ